MILNVCAVFASALEDIVVVVNGCYVINSALPVSRELHEFPRQ